MTKADKTQELNQLKENNQRASIEEADISTYKTYISTRLEVTLFAKGLAQKSQNI